MEGELLELRISGRLKNVTILIVVTGIHGENIEPPSYEPIRSKLLALQMGEHIARLVLVIWIVDFRSLLRGLWPLIPQIEVTDSTTDSKVTKKYKKQKGHWEEPGSDYPAK